MYSKIICGLLLLGCIVSIQSFKFPKDVERCHAGDTDCIVRVANVFVEFFGQKGHPGINMIPIDPLHIPNIGIKQGADSPVNIELKFSDVDLIGLSSCRITKISGFQSNPNGKYSLTVKGPALYLVGPYKISGRVLVLPVQGAGKSNITLVEPEITMTFDGKGVKRNNNEHVAMENAKLTFKIDRLVFNFENLYNGDKTLGESTNKFLNDNWSDIFREIKANIFDAFTLIAENTLRNTFNKVPYNDLFAN